MIKQRWGRIINMSSNAVRGSRHGTAYAASKAGVLGLSLSWALELAEYGIMCNAIRAHAYTRMTQESAERARQTARAGDVLPRGLSYYLLPPEAASPLVVFLASDHADGITGQFMGIDGPRLVLYSSIRPVSAAIMPNGWTVELLLKHFKTTVGRQLEDYSLPLS
jgi:NAD(P)-dependent dehydrogenase (short-subunit alcohol dehydrogenase family)